MPRADDPSKTRLRPCRRTKRAIREMLEQQETRRLRFRDRAELPPDQPARRHARGRKLHASARPRAPRRGREDAHQRNSGALPAAGLFTRANRCARSDGGSRGRAPAAEKGGRAGKPRVRKGKDERSFHLASQIRAVIASRQRVVLVSAPSSGMTMSRLIAAQRAVRSISRRLRSSRRTPRRSRRLPA